MALRAADRLAPVLIGDEAVGREPVQVLAHRDGGHRQTIGECRRGLRAGGLQGMEQAIAGAIRRQVVHAADRRTFYLERQYFLNGLSATGRDPCRPGTCGSRSARSGSR